MEFCKARMLMNWERMGRIGGEKEGGMEGKWKENGKKEEESSWETSYSLFLLGMRWGRG